MSKRHDRINKRNSKNLGYFPSRLSVMDKLPSVDEAKDELIAVAFIVGLFAPILFVWASR